MIIDVKELLALAGAIIAVAGSHFMLRARIMVLEERVKGYSKAIDRVFATLQRIEEKLDKRKE